MCFYGVNLGGYLEVRIKIVEILFVMWCIVFIFL